MKRIRNSYLAYFLMYNFYFLSFSLFSTLISVYMLDKGFVASQVSLVVSVSFIASMVTQPIMGLLNDRFGTKKVSLISFVLIICGAIYFMQASDLFSIAGSYAFVLMLINGVNPVMDMIAAKSPYTYGKIRIWGTIGYAMGSQLAGLIYQHIAPSAIFVVFIMTMLMSIFGVLEIDMPHRKVEKREQSSRDSYLQQILANKFFLFYLLIVALYSGVGNTGHTYIPSMLEQSGLSVGVASSIVSISVLIESPLIFYSYTFMDRFSVKKLMYLPLLMMMLQYIVYGLDIGVLSKILVTLLAKHTTGMLLIMVNLKVVSAMIDEKYVMTALALAQTARSLGSIFIQNAAGTIIDSSGYQSMSFVMVGIVGLVVLLVGFLKIPEGKRQNLFG